MDKEIKKVRITTLIDSDVLEGLKKKSKTLGLKYQTYINYLLKKEMKDE